MYRLTARMEQNFRQNIAHYHNLFDGGRCQGWELEELVVKAIRSDTTANHLPKRREGGHDDKADVLVVINGEQHELQVKSGRFEKQSVLCLSGYRLGRYKGDLTKISEYLNSRKASILSVPYRKEENASGRQHIYRFCYIDGASLGGIDKNDWQPKGASYYAENSKSVKLRLTKSQSWQVWWDIPPTCFHYLGDEFHALPSI